MVKQTRRMDNKRSRPVESHEPEEAASPPERAKGKYAEKYKYVRFVEKKKVLRKMRQLQKELISATESDQATLESSLSELRKDLMYIDKFPGNEKYISLFPTGDLSEECLQKQKAIRTNIVNLTNMSAARAERRKFDAVKNDDFFASVDNVEKPTRKLPEKPIKKGAAAKAEQEVRKKPATVHPSWEANKSNEKLTGSLTKTKFEGARMVFDEDD